VTLYTTRHINVTKFAPCVMLHHRVLNIRPSIVIHARDTFSVRNVFRIFDPQSEKQASLSVGTGMPKW